MSRETDAGRSTGPECCPLYHEAVELIGRRWTGAIVAILLDAHPTRPLRFGEISQAVPELSDRMLSERLRELEARGVVIRDVTREPSARVAYALTAMGVGLGPAVAALTAWAQHWLDGDGGPVVTRAN